MITGADAQPRSGQRFMPNGAGRALRCRHLRAQAESGRQGRRPGVVHQPRASNFLLSTGVLDDACEVVDSEVESVVGQLQRSPSGFLAAEVAELAGYVIAERPRAVPAREVVYRQQVEPGVESARWRVGAALPGVVVAFEPAAVVSLLDPWQVGLETGGRVSSGLETDPVQAVR